MLTDTLPKLGNDLPNTDAAERIAATLIVDHYTAAAHPLHSERVVVMGATLKPIWYLDFFRREVKR